MKFNVRNISDDIISYDEIHKLGRRRQLRHTRKLDVRTCITGHGSYTRKVSRVVYYSGVYIVVSVEYEKCGLSSRFRINPLKRHLKCIS